MERGEAWIAIHANAAWIATGAGGSCCPTQLADFAFSASRCLLGFARVDALLGRVRSSPTGS
jgi:hypothetical protein